MDDYTTIPPGVYVCRVAEVREGVTRDDDRRWSIRLTVHEGEYADRHAGWDSIEFSPRGLHRASMVLRALGLADVLHVDSQALVGRLARVDIRHGVFTVGVTGRRLLRNEVPYKGWTPLAAAAEAETP